MAVKTNERYIPLKNYIIAIVLVIAIILITWWAFAWYNVYKESKVSESYLVKQKIISQEIDDLSEIKDVLSEPFSNYFIYISYTGSEDIYNMEKDLKTIIVDYKLSDKFYYLNVTKIKDEKNVIDQINEALGLEGKEVKQIPTIVYVKEGNIVDVITREDEHIMNAGDFEKLLEINKIEK